MCWRPYARAARALADAALEKQGVSHTRRSSAKEGGRFSSILALARRAPAMLIAQALGEYSAAGALVQMFESLSFHVQNLVGEWGPGLLWVAGIAAVLWVVIGRFR
jgi:hypothetical protein